MDEINCPPLHRWLSVCRLLMLHHPKVAAELVAFLMGDAPLPFRIGWNMRKLGEVSRYKELFTFIDPEGGKTTPIPPSVPSESIHTVLHELPALESTQLWQVFEELAEHVSKLDKAPFTQHRVTEVRQNIISASAKGGVTHDTKMMRILAERALQPMARALHETICGQIKVGDFLGPAFDTVLAYLSFEIPGQVACEVLAFILSVQCTIPDLGSLTATPPLARIAAIEHLSNLTYTLLKTRQPKKVTPYFEMTYLAGLYGGAAVVLASHATEQGNLSRENIEKVEKLAMNVEEMCAHSVHMSFFLPALFSPKEGLERVITESFSLKEPPIKTADFYCIHPGLRSLLERSPRTIYLSVEQVLKAFSPRFLDMNSEEVLEAYQAYVSSCESLDLMQVIKSQFSPIAPDNLQKIRFDLLVLATGALRH